LKTPEEVMEILEAFDLTGTLRGAAELAGCDHKTVAHWVRAREEAGGGPPVRARPRPRVDAFVEKIEEWVDRSRGRIRADVAHQRLVAMGYVCSERAVSVDHVYGVAVRNRRSCRSPSLRVDDRHMRAGGPAEQGRLESHGPGRQGRPGPDRPQPATRL
jgi:hypothetical protein